MTLKRILVTGAGLTALAGPTAAQTISEVVVTATPYAVSAQSLASSANVVTRAQLDLAPAAGLGDLLSGLPGIRSTFFGPGASRPVIRGLSGPRVLILQNGVGQIDASDVSPDHAVASDPQEAVRIEVLRGPSTLTYGGSGIGGVVNVIDDRVPSAVAARGIEGRVSGSTSSNADTTAVGGHVKFGKGPLVFSLEGARKTADDYEAGTRALSRAYERANSVLGENTSIVRNTDIDLKEYGAGAAYIGGWGFVGASVRETRSVYGVPYAQIVGQPAGGDEGPVGIDLRQTRYDLRGQLKAALGPFAEIKFSAGHADYRHFEFARETGEVGTRFLSQGQEGRLELIQAERNGWQGAVGLQGLHRDFQAFGDEAFVPPSKTDQYALFTLQRLDKGGWGVEGGLRVEGVKVAADVAGRATSQPALNAGVDFAVDPSRRTFTNYSASGALFLRPSQPLFLSLNLSHNERAPTQYELFADGPHAGTSAYEIGDPNIGREKVNSVEALARYTRERLSLEGHLFYARYDGFIQETPTGEIEDGLPVQQFQQLDARFYGLEATAGYDLWKAADRTLRAEAVFDYVHGQTDQGPAPRIPPYGLTGRLIYETGRLTARVEARHVGRQDRILPTELPTRGYTLVNLFVSYKPVADQDFRLFAEVSNLGDVEAREHASFLKDIAPLPGRNVRAGIAYAF